MPLAVVAIGGNALARAGERGTIEEQFANARIACSKLSTLIEDGWDMVLTHGNGPQVGSMLWRVELAAQKVHPVDLGICDANSQGQIGYMLQQVFSHELRLRHMQQSVVTLVTQVEVRSNDAAFQNPQKPIGPFFSADEAKAKMASHSWQMKEDSGRGWRRVVPSPEPLQIVELPVIQQCVRNGIIPIAVGGGGIPVVRNDDDTFSGVEAVIDKDMSAGLLARRLGADVFIVCTAVPQVTLNFGSKNPTPLGEIDAAALKAHQKEGHFPAGSMGPKVEAALRFVAGGAAMTQKRALITDLDNLKDAMAGKAGTVVLP